MNLLKMNPNSIFAVLLRSPWWVSGGIALGLFSATRLALPQEFGPYAFFVSLPFMVIAGYTGWQAFRAPSEAGIAQSMERLRALSWAEFSGEVEDAFRREGYTVDTARSSGVDLELSKGGQTTLVGCKRWKVVRTGIEPLKELEAARRPRQALAIYVATGELTETARAFATQNNIRVLTGAELARLLPAGRPSSSK